MGKLVEVKIGFFLYFCCDFLLLLYNTDPSDKIDFKKYFVNRNFNW